jgi:hypothetical protein
MADVSQDRRETATHPGSTHTVPVDGSRLCWALPSPVHEGLGYRAFVPDRIQGDAVFPACVIHSPVQDHVSPSIARPIVPPIKGRAGLAAVKAWPGHDAARGASAVPASLDRGCARRSAEWWSGQRNALGRTKKLKCPLPEEFRGYACLLTSTAPYKDGWSAAIPILTRRRLMGFAALNPSYEKTKQA